MMAKPDKSINEFEDQIIEDDEISLESHPLPSRPNNHHKLLIFSVFINLCLLAALFFSRDYFFSRFMQHLSQKYQSVSSAHVKSSLLGTDSSIDLFSSNNPETFKKMTLNWSHEGDSNSFSMIYNQDSSYFQFNSKEFKDYFSQYTSKEQDEVLKAVEPIVSGQIWLKLDKEIFDSMNPSANYEREVLESKTIVEREVMESLTLRGIPSLKIDDGTILFKLPLKLNYQKLNQVLNPSLSSYIVKDQALLEELLNRATVDLYLRRDLLPAKIDISFPVPSQEEIEKVFGPSPANPVGQLNDRVKNSIGDQDKPIEIMIHFSEFNQDFQIVEPTNIISAQDLVNQLTRSENVTPVSTNRSGYIVNNEFVMKSSGTEVDKNLYQIHNMLYRHYNELGSYPSTLSPLANQYFPGEVPGNPSTAQSYYYQTFDNNQGYLLCPTQNSAREYCQKKFKLNSVN